MYNASFADFPTALDQAMERYKFEAEVIVRGSPRPRPRVRRNRMVPLLVRAGATIKERYADRSDYLKAVLDAGGVRAYEKQHRSALANIQNRWNQAIPGKLYKFRSFLGVGHYLR